MYNFTHPNFLNFHTDPQVSQKSGIWEGQNSSSNGAGEGPSRSVSHAASLDAISKRTIKQESTRVPCRSLTCSVCKLPFSKFSIHKSKLSFFENHSIPNLILCIRINIFMFFFFWDRWQFVFLVLEASRRSFVQWCLVNFLCS